MPHRKMMPAPDESSPLQSRSRDELTGAPRQMGMKRPLPLLILLVASGCSSPVGLELPEPDGGGGSIGGGGTDPGGGDGPGGDVTQRVAVPLYIHPYDPQDGNAWTRVIAAGPKVSYAVALVANPGDVGGPGTATEPAYTEAIQRAHAAGQRVLGYVDTSYAARPLATVEAEIDAWYTFYPGIDGIFLDQTPASGDPIATYYAPAAARVKARTGLRIVCINPGQPQIDELYMTHADLVMSYESPYASPINGYAPGVYSPPDWMASYPPERFWHAIREIEVDRLPEVMQLARERGAGHILVTNYPDPPAYSRLPVYFDQEIAAIAP